MTDNDDGLPVTAKVSRVQIMPALPKVNLNLPNVRVPEMMDITSYIPTAKHPPFLKEVHNFSVQAGGHVNREVSSIENNINKVSYKIPTRFCYQ